MNLLLIEDDEAKREDVQKFLSETFSGAVVEVARSYQSALKYLMSAAFDCAILDITIPTFDKKERGSSGRLRPFGGVELLDQLLRRGIDARVVVLTGYDILGEGVSAVSYKRVMEDISSRYATVFRGAVFYARAEGRWKDELRALVTRAITNK